MSTYSRIDYFFLTHKDLDRVQAITIDPIFISDHGPVHMDIGVNIVATRILSWRLNDSLLKDPITMTGALQGLEEYFSQNNQPKMSPTIVGGTQMLDKSIFFSKIVQG